MSNISSNVGPSPFLTSSKHHFHTPNYTTTQSYYSTNSYTNTPSFLAAYSFPTPVSHEKYFPKDMINVLPGVTNLSSEDQEKLIHPLNTYSGNVFSTHRINSPFNRGEIYYGNKDPMISSGCQSPASSFNDRLETETFPLKKDNPFNKKYLLSEKNKQLENYALYSSTDGHGISDYIRSKNRIKNRNVNQFPTKREPTFNSEDITNQVLQMTSKQKININNRGQFTKQPRSKTQNRSDKNYSNKNPFDDHILGQNYSDQYLVESEVDQKQFGSFGQGKQPNDSRETQEYKNYKQYENRRDNLKSKVNNQAESIIVGLTKMVNQENGKSKNHQQKTKKEPVFIDSDDDERKSGTFMVPNAIIEEINNPRIPSNLMRRKENQYNFSYERQHEKQKIKYSKQEAIQVGRNPPNRITMRGKTYEKILL